MPLLGAVVLALPVLARAQFSAPFWNMAMTTLQLDGLRRNLRNSAHLIGPGRIRVMGRRATTFRPSPTVTRRTVVRYAAWAKANHPGAVGRLPQPEVLWRPIAAKDGVRADDLADVYGEYWSTMWCLATGKPKSPA